MENRRRINREEVEQVTTASQDEETTIMEETKVEDSALATVFRNCAKVESAEGEEVKAVVEDEVETVDEADAFNYGNQEITSVDGEYVLEMVATVSPETMINSGVQLFLREKSTGRLMIGSDAGLKLDKKQIQDSVNHGVMYILKRFDVEFSEDSIIMAWKKARELLNNGKMTKAMESNSVTILDAYEGVVEEVYRRKSVPEYDITKLGKPVYIIKENEIMIETTKMAEILESTASGFKPATFCKRLAVAGAVDGFKYIERTSHGYARNTKNNVRYYILKVPKAIKEKLEIKGGECNA